jgi:hypothetical protein
VEKVLAILHDVKIIIGSELEDLKNLVKQIPVLRRDTDADSETSAAIPEFADYRGEFNRLRAGSEDE